MKNRRHPSTSLPPLSLATPLPELAAGEAHAAARMVAVRLYRVRFSPTLVVVVGACLQLRSWPRVRGGSSI